MNKIVLSAIVIAALLSFSGCNRDKIEEVEKIDFDDDDSLLDNF